MVTMSSLFTSKIAERVSVRFTNLVVSYIDNLIVFLICSVRRMELRIKLINFLIDSGLENRDYDWIRCADHETLSWH
jgi:hypothetical protein